ncbi:putative receptor protein kinase ZmPK1 [Macadamia integrifolia]|uniref:putative receptor protein kinase ZmPK1 n=1 Tax=Macadamia integrifolia TaxID=60698 RepID=UPI001C4F905C|nr:putative receptor protein kinase ZmPK1 [Macadamia integrifolia]
MRHQPISSVLSFPPLLLLVSLLFSFVSSSTPQNSLYSGSSLLVEDVSNVLTSPDNTFTCGFYPVGINAFCFSIWFTNTANRTVVWMANRDRPVNGHGSRILLQRDGTMVLTDLDGTNVWSTTTTTTGTNVQKAELLNSGNLILTDPQGKIQWQSFDSPTDTLLPMQPFTKSKKLISATGEGMYSSGYFSFFFDSDNVLKLIYDGPEISSLYWPDPQFDTYQNGRTDYNSSRIANLDDTGNFSSSDLMRFSASDMGTGIRRRLVMDYDGNLRLYSLNESTMSWVVSWQALSEQCNVHGLCGRNGICVYTPKPQCSCPPGYEVTDPHDWNKGCKPKFNLSCNPTQKVRFMKLPQTDFYGFDLAFQQPVSYGNCMNLCLNACDCQAFVYRLTGEGKCFTKSALFNGYKSTDFVGHSYLKLPTSLEISEESTPKGSDPTCGSIKPEIPPGSSVMYVTQSGRTKWMYLYSFALAIGAIEVLFVSSGWWFLFRRRGVPTLLETGYQAISSQFRMFTYEELRKATNKFKDELGRGSSGAVYKGVLGDNRVVAVKKLGDIIQGEEEFWAEVTTFGRINHMNLVRIWGFCSGRVHKLLVYEYAENGSLDKHLFSNVSRSDGHSTSRTTPLEWKERFRIAIGTAKGLAYLHHECLEWVIHCDVKPENILLDSDFEPKIADFGLSKLSQRGGSGSEFSRIRGTKGYMAPEWAVNLPITAKVDVYSYGVVLLEIVKGIRLSSWVQRDEDAETTGLTRFVREVKRKIGNGEDLCVEDVVDPELKGKFNRNQATMMVKIGISCVEEDRSKRPTMDAVVQALLKCEDEAHVF